MTLTWETENATSVTINNGVGSQALNGDKEVFVDSNTIFVLTASKGTEQDICTAPVTVLPPAAPSCDSFEANPQVFSNGVGGAVTLSWETTNTTGIEINYGVGTSSLEDGSLPTSFTASNITVPVERTYVLTAFGEDGSSVQCPAKVTIVPENIPVVSCSDVSFTASQTLVDPGDTVSLSWVFTGNVESASIAPNVANVMATSGVDVVVDTTTDYVMTVANSNNSVTCPLRITVTEPEIISCSNNVSFTADDYNLPRGGGDVKLTWSTTGLDSISINGVSSTNLSGSEEVRVNSDKTFTLTARKGTQVKECPISIDVSSGGGSSPSPKCDLDISDKKIERGEEITLTWDTTSAREVKITDNHGNVLLDSDDSDDFDGKLTIKPTEDTEYTLLSKRGSKERECEVEVDVKNNIVVLESRSQDPRVAGISLTQVPYTGFEAGPMLTTIFYFLLTLWGLFVAYVLVVRRDSIGGVSLAGAHDHVPYTDMSVEADTTDESSVADGYVQSVVAEAPVAPVAPAPVQATVPVNLPVATPVVGYEAMVSNMTEEETDESIEMTELENQAHAQMTLLSSDAMRYFADKVQSKDRVETLGTIIAEAKGTFPSEGGWVVINLARIESLMTAPEEAQVAVVPEVVTSAVEAPVATTEHAVTSGSLAEAIVSGNIVAAYQMIDNRPMVALSDAAADLDLVFRARKGDKVTISDVMETQTAHLSLEQIVAAIEALTGALDGTYTDEASAVKMAIMKAVKATA